MGHRSILGALAAGLVLAVASTGAAAGVTYEVVDIADPVGAPDTVRINYRIDTGTPAWYGYTLYFDPALYAGLEADAGASWFATIAQPDPAAPLPGLVNLLALQDIAAGAEFSVLSTWLGTGRPGAQPYELFDDTFNIVGGGVTQAVPEPASATLLIAGLAVLLRYRYRR